MAAATAGRPAPAPAAPARMMMPVPLVVTSSGEAVRVLVEVPVVAVGSVELLAHDDAVRGVVALSFAVFRAVSKRQGVRLTSPAVAFPISPITSFPPSPVAPTHAGCDQGVPRLVSLLSISPDAIQPVGSSPEQICRGGWPSLVGHLQSLPKDVGKFRDHI